MHSIVDLLHRPTSYISDSNNGGWAATTVVLLQYQDKGKKGKKGEKSTRRERHTFEIRETDAARPVAGRRRVCTQAETEQHT